MLFPDKEGQLSKEIGGFFIYMKCHKKVNIIQTMRRRNCLI